MSFKYLLGAVCLCLLLVSTAIAEVPKMINYQGKITTPQGALIDTTIPMTFAIYTDSIGTDSVWSETQSAVVVEKGIFSVLLGSVNPIPDSVFTGEIRYLGFKAGDDPEMTPRKPIVSIGYTFNSDMLNGRHAGNVEGNIPINDGNLNVNLNADFLDGFDSEAFSSPINKVVRGMVMISSGLWSTTQSFSPEIDPNKSVVVLDDGNVYGCCVQTLTSSVITIHATVGRSQDVYVSYQIIEYK